MAHKQRSSSLGFSLIEMMVVIALLGLLLALVIPRLARRSPAAEWKAVLSEFNNLTQFARQESIAEQTIFRLNFTSGKNQAPDSVTVERLLKIGSGGKQEFIQASSPYLPTKYELAGNIRFRSIFHGKQDQLQVENQAFCYIIPDGLAQHILIHLTRVENLKEETVTLKMLSFEGYFELIEEIVRPGQEAV